MKYLRFDPSFIKNDKTHPHLQNVSKCWHTECGTYQILFDEINGFKHLRIARIDSKPIHDFMVIQQIKNDLFGKEVIAVEIFPKEKDFVNGSNTYHLWTWPGIEIQVPNLKELYTYNLTENG